MPIIKKYAGYLLLILLLSTPIVLWLNSYGIDRAFGSGTGRAIAASGKSVALIGYTLFCLQPILSMRNKLIENLFGGLNKVYRLHILAGKVSFGLILLHPLLLGLGRYLSGRSLGTIWNWTGLVVVLGIIAIVLLIIITVATLYAHVRHQHWILIHRLYGGLLPLFFMHGYFAQAQMVLVDPLFWYLTGMTVIGLLAFLYRSIFGKYLVKKHAYEVVEVNHFTKSTTEVVLRPKGSAMHYQAGQFAYVSFDNPQLDGEAHPYSFSNDHNGPYIRFTIKALGDDTSQLTSLATGTIAYIEGPFGKFSYKNSTNHRQVWIAGGIGITPFLSMARSFSGKQKYDIRFFYGTESLDEAVFLQEFIDITRHLPDNFDTKVVAKNVSGFITIDLLKSSLTDITAFDYFICGPPAMMQSLQKQLLAAGVPKKQLHIESFSIK